MAKPTDVKVIGVSVYFLPVRTRVPLKFGTETLTEVTCARVRVRVADGDLGGFFAAAAAAGAAAGFAKASRGAADFRAFGARAVTGGAAESGTSCGGAIGFGEAGRRGNSCGTRYVNVVL